MDSGRHRGRQSQSGRFRFEGPVTGSTTLWKASPSQHLAEQDANGAVCESTGGYERLVVDRLCKTGRHLHVAQPTRVRAFARACGYQAKTDQRDAQVLSRFGSVFQDHDAGITMPDPELEELPGPAAPAPAACRTAGTGVGASRQGSVAGRCRINQPPHRLA